jgi:hypothetical protein
MSNSRYYVVGDCDMWVIECAPVEQAQCTSGPIPKFASFVRHPRLRTSESRTTSSSTILVPLGTRSSRSNARHDMRELRVRGTSRTKLIAFAIGAAQELGMRGERAHVCLLDHDGRLRSRWTFNRHRPAPDA